VQARNTQRSRREQVEESLKELELRQSQAKRPPLSTRIHQAGLAWSKRQFILISAALGLAAFVAAFIANAGPLVALSLAFAAGLGAPRWLLAFLKKRRQARFLHAFPDAVDVIVRGIKAGLPLLECIRIVTNDAPEPVKSEFRAIVETQTIGMPLGEACAKLHERMAVPEANFFGIVIAIQQKSGGNLSEALGNLSRVLRDRKKMKAKIQAMSMEAKASAAIIGALPVIVMLLVYITSPDYISLLWTHPMGRVMLVCSAFWMSMGVLVMKKMINFDF
jgi:tight adherence protein B